MHGYLIDMDGVIYRGSELIAGADEFIHNLRRRRIPFCWIGGSYLFTEEHVAAIVRLFEVAPTEVVGPAHGPGVGGSRDAPTIRLARSAARRSAFRHGGCRRFAPPDSPNGR